MATDVNNVKSKKTQPPTKPGVVDLALASDTPVEKAPEKLPEPKESENEAEEKSSGAIVPRKPDPKFLTYFLAGLKEGKQAMPSASKAALSGAAIGTPLGFVAGRMSGSKEAPPSAPAEAAAPEAPGVLSQLGTGLGHLGSAELRGIGALLGSLGLPGAEERLQGWSEHPDIPKYVGGGTTVLGTILAAMLARRLMRGDKEVEASISTPNMRKSAYMAGFALGARKRASMGVPVAPLHNSQSEIIPTRTGLKSSTRSENYDAVEKLTRPALRYR